MQKVQPTILLVDDEDNCLRVISDVFELEGIDCITANTGEKALELFDQYDIDIVVTDIKMPGLSGMDLLKEIKNIKPDTYIIMMTGYGSIGNAIESIKQGAYQYVIKPIMMDDFITQIKEIMEQLQNGKPSNIYRPTDTLFDNELQGSSARIKNIRQVINVASTSNIPVLITGENGTGKELAAMQIHKNSDRAGKNFVTINCSSCLNTNIEQDLFGSQAGKPSELEKANGGTLYLEEIGNIKPSLQSKLLELLTTGAIKAGHDIENIDIRFIASTSHNLEQEVEEGVFDAELYYLLRSVHLHMPSLQEIKKDIPEIANYYVKMFNPHKSKNIKINKETIEALQNYTWPGNVRELINVVRGAVSVCENNEIQKYDLPAHLTNGNIKVKKEEKVKRRSILLADIEQEHIMNVLQMAKGNKSLAATMLGIHRDTLLRKLKKYGVD